MTQDYRPTCSWCLKQKLNKKEREQHKKTNLCVCKKCDKILSEMISDSFR